MPAAPDADCGVIVLAWAVFFYGGADDPNRVLSRGNVAAVVVGVGTAKRTDCLLDPAQRLGEWQLPLRILHRAPSIGDSVADATAEHIVSTAEYVVSTSAAVEAKCQSGQ